MVSHKTCLPHFILQHVYEVKRFPNSLLFLFHDCVGQYAPFGYVVEGLDIMQNLQAGDIISATNLNEWGKLNLKKIRTTSFANAIVQSEEDD